MSSINTKFLICIWLGALLCLNTLEQASSFLLPLDSTTSAKDERGSDRRSSATEIFQETEVAGTLSSSWSKKQKKECGPCPDDDIDEEGKELTDIDRLEAAFATIGSLWAEAAFRVEFPDFSERLEKASSKEQLKTLQEGARIVD